MKKSIGLLSDLGQIETVDMLAQTFKGISSHHIAVLKNQTLLSKEFFSDLWGVYTQLKVIKGGT